MSRRRRPLLLRAVLVGLLACGAVLNGPIARAAVDAVTVTATPNPVVPASTVDLRAGIPVANAAGLASQEIVQVIDPTKIKLRSRYDITAPAGWTLSYSTNGVTYTAPEPTTEAGWALIKGVKAQGQVETQGSIDGRQVTSKTAVDDTAPTGVFVGASRSGDGWDVIFDDAGHVFNVFHHDGNGGVGNGAIDCHMRSGANCPGTWPYSLTANNMHTPQNSSGWYDPTTHRMYLNINTNNQAGFVCLDLTSMTAANKWCGGTATAAFVGLEAVTLQAGYAYNGNCSQEPYYYTCINQMVEVGGRLFAWNGRTNHLLCLNTRAPGSGAACSGQPVVFPGVTAADWGHHPLVAWQGRIYGTPGYGQAGALCVVAATLGTCPGWTGAAANLRSFSPLPRAGRVTLLPDASGATVGVCYLLTNGAMTCFDAAGATITPPSAFVTAFSAGQLYARIGQVNAGQVSGSRLYWGNGGYDVNGKLFCWDMALNSGAGDYCTNWGGSAGKTDLNYTAVLDPINNHCLWTNDDGGEIKTWDTVTATVGCTTMSATVNFHTDALVPRMGCDANTAIGGWRQFKLNGPASYTGATLTVTTDTGAPIAGWTNVAIPGSAGAGTAIVDLTSLDPSVSGQNPNFSVNFATRAGNDAASATITAVGDAPQLCLTPTAVMTCPAAIGPIDDSEVLGSTTTVTGSGASTLTGGSRIDMTPDVETVTVASTPKSLCGSVLSGVATEFGASTTPIPGVVATLIDATTGLAIRDASNNPVTVTTAVDGSYSFGYLAPGSYKVSFASASSGTLYQARTATTVSGAAGTSAGVTNATGTGTSSVALSNTVALAVGTDGVVNAKYIIPVVATPDTSTGKQGVVQTISVLGNDTASSGASYTGGSTALKLCGTGQSYPNCTATSWVSAGQGSYAVSGTNITFTPCSGVNTPVMTPACTGAFTGTATPATYQSTDSAGRTASSTVTPTVVPPPTATADTSTGNLNTVQTITPLSNDTTGSGTTLLASSMKLCTTATANASCTGTTLNVAGQGTYTLNVDGTVSFAPCQAAGSSGASCTGPFAGTATPIKYVVSDALGQQTSSTITPSVNAPAADVATPDTSSGVIGAAQTVNPLANDTSPTGVTLKPTTVKLCGSGQSPPTCAATSLIVAGKGVYTVNAVTGALTFTPCNNTANNLTVGGTSYATGCTGTPFTGTPAAATYQVTDDLAASSRTVSSTYTPTVVGVPTASPDTSSGAFGATQTISILANDSAGTGGTLTASSIKLCAAGTAAASCTGSTYVSSGKGVFTANVDGTVSFAPCTASGVPDALCTAPFTGAVPAIGYRVTDALGQFATSTITVSVNPPAVDVANPDTSTGFAGVTQTVDPLANDTHASGVSLVASTVKLCTGAQVAPGCTGRTLTNAQGTYTVNAVTGAISFAPCTAAGVPNGSCTGAFTGTATPVSYQVSDNLTTPRTVSSTYTPTVVGAPVATNDTSSGAFGSPQTIAILGNDTSDPSTTLSPASVKLCDPSVVGHNTPPACLATTLTTVDGTYVVNANGTVTFTPASGFSGTARSPPTYQVSDSVGQTASATITPTVDPPTPPTARADTATVKAGGSVAFTAILGNGGLASPGAGALTTARLCDPGTTPAQTPPNCTATTVTTSDGTYTVNPATGVVTYTNTDGTSGAKTGITYQVNDANGQQASSTLTPTVVPAPVGKNDTSSGEQGQDQVIAPLGNDAGTASPLVPSSIKLCLTGQSSPNCTGTSNVPAMSGGTQVGTYTVNANGTVLFHPSDPSWTGTLDPIGYQVTDETGQVANANITVIVLPKPAPVLTPDAQSGPYGSPIVMTVLSNDSAGTAPADSTTGAITTSIRSVAMNASSVRLCGTAQVPPSCTATSVTTVDGTYTLSGSTVTFTGAAGFTGTVTQPLMYQASNTYNEVIIDNSSPTVSTTTTNPASTCLGAAIDGCAYTPATDSNGVAPGGVGYIPTWTVSQGSVTTTPKSQTSSTTITPTITITPATMTNDTATTLVNHPVTLTPLANDTAGSFAFSAPTLKLCNTSATPPQSPTPAPGTCDANSVTIAGQGTFVLDPATGQVTFTPASNFTGPATVPYVVTDVHGSVSTATISITVNAPTATSDVSYGLAGNTQTINVLSNDAAATGTGTTLTNSSVKLCGVGEAVPLCSKTSLTTVDGTYTVSGTGVVTFVPAAEFVSGAATAPVTYQVSDSGGEVASATITPTIVPAPTPSATDDTGSAPAGQSVVFTPTANDSAGSSSSPAGSDITFANLTLSATSVTLCDAGQAAPNCTATSLTTSEGTYTVNPDGTVTFAPASGFTGTATYPVKYQILNTYDVTDHGVTTTGLHQTATALLTPTIVPPPQATATNDTGSAAYGQPVTFTPWLNDTKASTTTNGSVTYTNTGTANGFDPASVKLCGAGEIALPTGSGCTATTVTTAAGTYVVNGGGTVTFTPASGFSGTDTSPPTYQITSPYSVANSSPTYAGTGSSITSAQLIPTIAPLAPPVAIADATSGIQDHAVAFVLPTNDAAASVSAASTYPTDPATVLLCSASEVAPACTQTSVVKPGQGVFVLTNAATGEVTFTPCSAAGVPDASCTGSWTGLADVYYSIADTAGTRVDATFTVTIVPGTPLSATDDTRTTPYETPVTVDVSANDTAGSSALVPTSVLLCGPTDTAPTCTQTSVTNVTGTFTVNADGTVTYTPATGFTGPAAVTYSISDVDGNVVSALLSITVTVPPHSSGGGGGGSGTRDASAVPSSVDPSPDPTPAPTAPPATCVRTSCSPSGPDAPPTRPMRDMPVAMPHATTMVMDPDGPATLNPFANARPSAGHTFVTSSLRIWDGSAWTTTVSQPGIGAWSVERDRVSFMPAPGYRGMARMRFVILDTAGLPATSTLQVKITPRLGDVPAIIDAGVAAVSPIAFCPNSAVGGPAIGTVRVNGVSVPIKPMSYPAGGTLEPPASNRVVGLSTRHAPLNARSGTSVLAWHVRYGPGCDGDLNTLLDEPIGSTFTVAAHGAVPVTYRITDRVTVPKGHYPASWFYQSGPHRLALFTCGGLVNGVFTTTVATFAEPVTASGS